MSGNQINRVVKVVPDPGANQNGIREFAAIVLPDGEGGFVDILEVLRDQTDRVVFIEVATAIGTAAKTTTSPLPRVGATVYVSFTNGNSAGSPTISFNGGAAKPVLLGGVAPTGGKITVAANGIVPLVYDGTSLHMFGTIA